jgi:hypothetical protein
LSVLFANVHVIFCVENPQVAVAEMACDSQGSGASPQPASA